MVIPRMKASPPRTTTRLPAREPSLARRAFTSCPDSSIPAAKASFRANLIRAFLYCSRVAMFRLYHRFFFGEEGLDSGAFGDEVIAAHLVGLGDLAAGASEGVEREWGRGGDDQHLDISG